MKTTIYYFTGTGNSLVVAREIAAKLEECELVPIAGLIDQKRVVAPGGRVGFVFPLYYYGAPDAMIKFLQKVDLTKTDYLFSVVTLGSVLGAALDQVNGVISEQGRTLDSGFYVRMPGNYLVMYGGATEKSMNKDFTLMKERVEHIAAVIKKGGSEQRKENWFEKKVRDLVYPGWAKEVNKKSRLFAAETSCNGCGVCSKVCPVNNIELKDGRPCWNDRCEDCMACIQYCPVEALQAPSKKTKKRTRYTHPEVSVTDMAAQKSSV